MNPESETPNNDVYGFVYCEYVQAQHVHIELPFLSAGDYMIFVLADWTEAHKLRKLISNLYLPQQVPIVRESSKGAIKDSFDNLQDPLNIMLGEKETYKLPKYSQP